MSTLERYLSSQNLRKWLAKRRVKLTAEHAAKRLQWAREHRYWTLTDWYRVIWSDKCTVEKAGTARQRWVFRHPWEKWLPECCDPKPKHKSASLMVWACFCGLERGELYCLDDRKTMNAEYYINMLSIRLLPFWRYLLGIELEPLFMQDGAKVHTAKLSMAFFEDHGIMLYNHPPYSPDLNPIEHIWVHMKHKLHRMYPDVVNLRGSPQTIQRRLAEILPQVWEEIPEGYFEAMLDSMPDRVQAVIDARGWYTRY